MVWVPQPLTDTTNQENSYKYDYSFMQASFVTAIRKEIVTPPQLFYITSQRC